LGAGWNAVEHFAFVVAVWVCYVNDEAEGMMIYRTIGQATGEWNAVNCYYGGSEKEELCKISVLNKLPVWE
jgi:hypothetical protein